MLNVLLLDGLIHHADLGIKIDEKFAGVEIVRIDFENLQRRIGRLGVVAVPALKFRGCEYSRNLSFCTFSKARHRPHCFGSRGGGLLVEQIRLREIRLRGIGCDGVFDVAAIFRVKLWRSQVGGLGI